MSNASAGEIVSEGEFIGCAVGTVSFVRYLGGDVEDHADSGMAQLREGPRFAPDALAVVVAASAGGQDFQGDVVAI